MKMSRQSFQQIHLEVTSLIKLKHLIDLKDLPNLYKYYYGKPLKEPEDCNNLYSLCNKFARVKINHKKQLSLIADCDCLLLEKQNPSEYAFQALPRKIEVNCLYQVEVKKIYDPNKLWICIYQEEYAAFQQCINEITGVVAIPRPCQQVGLACLVYLGRYHRAIICSGYLLNKSKIRVFMIDQGEVESVPIDQLYYIPEKYLLVPRFAIRACLSSVFPINGANWHLGSISLLKKLIFKKKLLAFINAIDSKRNVLYIELKELASHYCATFNQILLDHKFALKAAIGIKKNVYGKYKTTSDKPYNYPLFESIEGGLVFRNINELNAVMPFTQLDLLYSHLKYNK